MEFFLVRSPVAFVSSLFEFLFKLIIFKRPLFNISYGTNVPTSDRITSKSPEMN